MNCRAREQVQGARGKLTKIRKVVDTMTMVGISLV